MISVLRSVAILDSQLYLVRLFLWIAGKLGDVLNTLQAWEESNRAAKKATSGPVRYKRSTAYDMAPGYMTVHRSHKRTQAHDECDEAEPILKAGDDRTEDMMYRNGTASAGDDEMPYEGAGGE